MTPLRVMTYNVRSCRGLDGRVDAERVAAVIERYTPDVVALQEIDAPQARTGYVHQAEWLARRLGMHGHFAPAHSMFGGHYGNAVLSRPRMQILREGALPRGDRSREPRAAVWMKLTVDGAEVLVLNTHLGLRARERGLQVAALLGSSWLGDSARRQPTVLCGDLNATPRSRIYRSLTRRLRDVQKSRNHGLPRTWPAPLPLLRLDYVLVSDHCTVRRVRVPYTRQTRRTSDHLPVIADLAVRGRRGAE